MEVKLGNILNAKEGLNVIASAKFRASKLFEVTKFVQNAAKEIDDFEKVRLEKIKEYGIEKENDKGENVIEVTSENHKEFVEDLNELINKEIEIDLPKISRDELGDVEMSPKELMSISWIFEDENNGD
jgi:mannose/fructose/N-acetylgalactosamine-specific phosphotransferase system component IIB